MQVQRLHSDSDAPAIDRSVKERLEAIHPGIHAVWKRYMVDYHTGRYLVAERGAHANRPIPWEGGGGRWIVCMKNKEGFHILFVVRDEDGGFLPLDHRVCDRLVLDAFMCARFKPDEMEAIISDGRMVQNDRLKARLADMREQFNRANRRKFGEVLEGDNLSRPDVPARAAKIFSYDGQPIRRTSAEDAIELLPEETGWEMPNYRKEIHGG